MAVEAQAQATIYETTIENADLEAALEDRERAKARKSETIAAFRIEDEKAKALIETLDIADAPVRVGRFVVSRREVAAREVSFETEPTSRLNISLIGD